MTWTSLVVLLIFTFSDGANDFSINNTFHSEIYGTELLLFESDHQSQRSSYRLEDFFWTGSGDGLSESEEDYTLASNKPTTTIYKTTTILSTLYVESKTETSVPFKNTTLCTIDCETTPNVEITPTPTFNTEETSTEDYFDADRHYWVLTVLKSDGKDPVIIDLKNSLAKLYKTAFQRQQDKHLGIATRKRRQSDVKKIAEKPVQVYIHGVDSQDQKIQVLYHVAVSGKPIDAVTAAKDMSLVSDEEVVNELGYPFLIKAEPYIKPTTQSLIQSNNTWIFIAVSIAALFTIFLAIAFLSLALSKRKKSALNSDLADRHEIFERGSGKDNKAYEQSPTYIKFDKQTSTNQRRKNRSLESSISTASSSSASLDISPLMHAKKQRVPVKKPPRPKAAVKRIAPELFDSDSSQRESPEVGNLDPGVVSPKSYLSMPSVKLFPRGSMPEPLNKVLEPESVLHLDMPDDSTYPGRPLTRHGSAGTAEDPGVLGPVVWSMHCQKLHHGVSVDEGINDLKTSNNVSRMRKRFHDLLDDTFSLFGSRRESPVDSRTVQIEVKSHSAVNRQEDSAKVQPRPKTSDQLRSSTRTSCRKPTCAWGSTAPSNLIRPLSADISRKPQVNVQHVLAEGKFQANDPAVPLIAAIKSEIEKCSLPGSTADLHQ